MNTKRAILHVAVTGYVAPPPMERWLWMLPPALGWEEEGGPLPNPPRAAFKQSATPHSTFHTCTYLDFCRHAFWECIHPASQKPKVPCPLMLVLSPNCVGVNLAQVVAGTEHSTFFF